MILHQFKIANKTFYILIGVFLFILFGVGFFLGRSSKKCPEIVKEIITSDTIEYYIGSSPVYLESKPHNVIIEKKVPIISKIEIKKTDTFYKEYPTFMAIDTLRNDSLFVAILDSGNCNGIIMRHSIFGGKIKTKTITNTITKVLEKPSALFQLNGGVHTQFNKAFLIKDIGPLASVCIKQNHSLGYSYLLNSKTHNIFLTTKIK